MRVAIKNDVLENETSARRFFIFSVSFQVDLGFSCVFLPQSIHHYLYSLRAQAHGMMGVPAVQHREGIIHERLPVRLHPKTDPRRGSHYSLIRQSL